MEPSKKTCYNYDVHADATLSFKHLVAQHNQRAREEGFYYLNNPATVVEMNPDLPAPFVPSVAMPASGLVIDLVIAQRSIYISEKNGYDAREREIKQLRAKHLIQANKAIAALTDTLDVKCAARQQMEAHLVTLADEVPHQQYLLAKKKFYEEWSPSLPQDAELHLNVLKTSSARDGRGFARYDIEFSQAANALTDMHQLPLPAIMMKYLYDGTKDVPGVGVYLNKMRDDIKTDAVAGAAVPVVPRWRLFLTSVAQQLKDFPGDDLLTAMVLYIAGAKIPAMPATGYCSHCGRFGHLKPSCRCMTTGGSCICGHAIPPGAPNHPVDDAVHSKAREISHAKFMARNPGGRGGRGPGGRGGRGDSRGGGRGGRGGGRGRGRGPDSNSGNSKEGESTHEAHLAALVSKQEEQGRALQVLIKSGVETRQQIEDALDADIKTSQALTLLEDKSKGTQSGKRKRT